MIGIQIILDVKPIQVAGSLTCFMKNIIASSIFCYFSDETIQIRN